MDKAQTVAQRDAFWTRVYELAKRDRDIILISADMGAPSLDQFRRDLPGQFINVGIAEQNATTLAAGLALAGKKVFTYGIAPFVTLRCYEQIRVGNAIMGLPITIVGVGVGFGYEDSGPTHHLIEDIAVMRVLPKVRVVSVTDTAMARHFAGACCERKTWTDYIRLDRLPSRDFYNDKSDFSKGFSVLREGSDVVIVAAAGMVASAMDAAEKLSTRGQKVGVIDLFRIPPDVKSLLPLLRKAKRLVSLEEHFLAGGLGSYLAELVVDEGLRVPLKRLGLPLEKGYCYHYGGKEACRHYYGVGQSDVEAAVREFARGKTA